MVVNWRSMNEEERTRFLEQIRPKGEWLFYPNIPKDMYCSICGMDFEINTDSKYLFNFCPHCGADMRGEKK